MITNSVRAKSSNQTNRCFAFNVYFIVPYDIGHLNIKEHQ